MNNYGNGICISCGKPVVTKTRGPRGKWCTETCRARHRFLHNPDMRIRTCRLNAKRRNIHFDLKPGDIDWVVRCPLLDIHLEYDQRYSTNDNAPSVDRIDTKLGYTKDNTWVISSKANRMKNDASKEELKIYCTNMLGLLNGSDLY